MTTREITSDLAAVLAAIPKGENGIFDITDVEGTRAAVRELSASIAAQTPEYPGITTEDLTVPRPDGGETGIHVLRPDAEGELPVVLWFHGGGQVLGYAAQDDPNLKRMIDEVGCAVVSVEYRLAPEHRAPAGAEDALAAYRYVVGNAESLGFDRSRIGIAGMSGGGAIAAALSLMIRDQGLPRPLFLSLHYAMLDDRNETASSREIVDLGVWDRRSNLLAWSHVLGDDPQDVSPYQAPARATDLTGLPPTFLAIAELDVVRDENLHFGWQLIAAGVPVELHHFPGAFHAWDLFAPDSRQGRQLNAAWYDYLRNAFA